MNRSLNQEMKHIFEDTRFYSSIWGVAIQSLNTSEFIFLKNENINLIPASNLKLFTTAAALVNLSPEYRIKTSIYHTGTITENGVLKGDLIIVGRGDPSICGRYHDGNITFVFDTWADSLKKYGVTKIDGNIIGDDNYFDDIPMGQGWAWDYQSDWYAAQISALSFNDNCVDIVISPGDSVNHKAKIVKIPDIKFGEINNYITTTNGSNSNKISFIRSRGINEITFQGQININDRAKRHWVTIENPTLYFVESFKQILEDHGIETTGKAFDIDQLTAPIQLHDSLFVFEHYSPPLLSIIKTINKSSQNLYAELILRILGAEFKGIGSAENGIKVIREFITSMGINPANFTMVDGSGLSRLNLVTPKDIVTLLKYMYSHKYADSFISSLSISGVDGTLKNRLNHESSKGKVKGKTGYLGNVVSLSGYIERNDDDVYIFCLINNNYSTPTAMSQELQELVCERIINYSPIQ